MEYITVKEAAAILGVTVARVHQYLTDPCPDCGRTIYSQDEILVEYNSKGCPSCQYTGRRLVTHGTFGPEHKAGYRLKEAEVRTLGENRKPGYPKGRKRRI